MLRIRHTLLTGLVLSGLTSIAYAQCGEQSHNFRCNPRILPGAPGVYEVVTGVANATPDLIPACGFNIGHTVWFRVIPTQDSTLTFTTCHPATSYDTVLQVWGGICDILVPLEGQCNDDFGGDSCINGCSFRGSTVSFDVFANEQYFFQVGSWNTNSAGCELCLGIELTICAGDATAPDAEITSPGAFGCGCNPVEIIGTANDSAGASYVLEYRPADGGDWSFISSSTTPVVNGVLANWDTTGLPENWYLLRLTVENACGLVSTAVNIVRVSKQFDSLDLRSPTDGAILGGTVCFDGTVWDGSCFDRYTVEYQPAGGGPFSPVDPGNPQYFVAVTNDPFASWQTIDLGIADGDYNIRVRAIEDCSNVAEEFVEVTIDNTAPTAIITEPFNCDYVDGVVEFSGTADDANLASWSLQYTGGDAHDWVTIASDTLPVVNGALGSWDTSDLPACAYTIRLVVTDRAIINCNGAIRHRSEYEVSLNVGICGDCDLDKDVDLPDFALFQENFTGPLP